jgi:hypothetical protein
MNEQRLFTLIKEKLLPDLEKTDQYNFSDATSKEYDYQIELKCRASHYRFLMIEKVKYDKLMTSKNPRYINSIPVHPYENTYAVYSWDLKKLDQPRWFEKWCKETTEFGPVKYVKKWVAMLDTHKAKNLSPMLFN